MDNPWHKKEEQKANIPMCASATFLKLRQKDREKWVVECTKEKLILSKCQGSLPQSNGDKAVSRDRAGETDKPLR